MIPLFAVVLTPIAAKAIAAHFIINETGVELYISILIALRNPSQPGRQHQDKSQLLDRLENARKAA